MSQALVLSGLPTTLGLWHKAVPELEACCESQAGCWTQAQRTGKLVWGRTGWVKLGPQGSLWLCTLSARTALREGTLTSSPLLCNAEQRQERNSSGLGALVQIQHYTQQKMEKKETREEKSHYVRTALRYCDIRTFIMELLNKQCLVTKQTMGEITDLQSFFHKLAWDDFSICNNSCSST